MNPIKGKWMFNTGSEENWQCEEGEFDTCEEAVEAGKRYFNDPGGYENDWDEKYEGDSFDVGQILEPNINIQSWIVIDALIEQVGDQCGEASESWLSNVKRDDEILLGDMLTDTFKEWLKRTKNEPNFFSIDNIQTIKL